MGQCIAVNQMSDKEIAIVEDRLQGDLEMYGIMEKKKKGKKFIKSDVNR